ncbi:heterokaryon incompatibility protein-domain-containing protein [Cladorrhinum sp. PSN259]|nr:heterokaryon incompatibility protein-domain-containing protein [Cladorrhinum sp. PSN259]
MEPEKCQGCGELDYNTYGKPQGMSNDRGPRRWTATFNQLRKGEVDGCQYCRVILQGAKWAWGENPEVVGEELGHPHWRCKDCYSVCPFETLYDLKIDIRPGRRLIAWRECPSQLTAGWLRGLRPSPSNVDFIEFYTPKGSKIFHPAFGVGREVLLKLSLEHVLSVVKPWLLECDNLHPACQESARILPRRLIDITETPRLIETSITGLVSDTKYATLSYRWGEEDDAAAMPKTLSTNIEKRIESIAWEQLPPAFRDAIEISRALSCAYIWIDAFCIIQDDEDDWKEQSVLMSQVYSYAYFNLAASALENTLGSLFQNRICRIGQNRYHGTSLMDIHRVTGLPATDTEVQKALLTNACSPGTPAKEVFNFWFQAVEQYSFLQLTEESDRLIALGGIARKIQEATGFTYLAGLWLEDLPRALYWRGAGTFCRYIGDSPFGQVLSGQIQMSAAYVRGTVAKTGVFNSVYIDIGPLAQRITTPPDTRYSKADMSSKTGILVQPEVRKNSNGSWVESLVGTEVFCILLGRIGTTDNRHQTNVDYYTRLFYCYRDCVLVVVAHPDDPQKYLRFGSHDVGSNTFQAGTSPNDSTDFRLFSPLDMEELYKDADVKVFNLV